MNAMVGFLMLACCLVIIVVICPGTGMAADMSATMHKQSAAHEMSKAALSDKPVPMVHVDEAALTSDYIPMISVDAVGEPSGPILEFGDPFLRSGRLSDPIVLPTGAAWNPSIWVFGNYRGAFQMINDQNRAQNIEAVNRLDLFANLQLSGTERIVVGISPLQDGNRLTRYTFTPKPQRGGTSALGAPITTLFAEFELGEVFPGLDPNDQSRYDIGVAVGRQLLEFQDGFLINDILDSVGIVQNNINFLNTINTRGTALFAWNEVNRGNNIRDNSARLYGLFSSFDLPETTIDVDVIFVDSPRQVISNHFGKSVHGGISASQRFGGLSTTGRLLGSWEINDHSTTSQNGVLAFLETSTSFYGKPHIFYANGFVGVGRFASASRAAGTGGPLGRTGLLFAGLGLGNFNAPLNNRGQDSIGAAIGYQMFFKGITRQLAFELGGDLDIGGNKTSGFGFGVRYSHKLFRRVISQSDGYIVNNTGIKGLGYGVRTEVRVLF